MILWMMLNIYHIVQTLTEWLTLSTITNTSSPRELALSATLLEGF